MGENYSLHLLIMCARSLTKYKMMLSDLTGAAKSTPVTSLEIQTEIEPLNIRREKYTLKLAEKCTRLPVDHWKNYIH
jgi:hypothetical protein